jgi:O-antigen/teichoic acid export membrane protein
MVSGAETTFHKTINIMTSSSISSLRTHLIRVASGSIALKISNTALSILMAVVLARLLGVSNFGVYAFCLSVVNILTIPAMLGGQELLVREVAAYQTKCEYQLLRGLLLRFRQASFLASALLALCLAGIGFAFYKGSPMLTPFLISAAILPLYTAMELQGAALRGLRYVLLGQIALTLRPALVVVIVFITFWITRQHLSAESALLAQSGGSAVMVALTALLLHNLLPNQAKNAQPKFEIYKWSKSVLPFVFASGMQVINQETSIVLLGILKSPEDVGYFRVAQRCAMLIPFGLHAINIAIAPTVAEMFAKGEKKLLQRVISKSIFVTLGFAIPVVLTLILFGKLIISFVFGQEFAPAYTPLVILCIGQAVNAGMGSVDLILNMAGLERITALGVAIATITSIVLNLILIPFLGTTGAAIATSFSLALWNVLLFFWLYKATGVVSTFLPLKINNPSSSRRRD